MLVRTGQEEEMEVAVATEQTVSEIDRKEVLELTILELSKEEVAVMMGPREENVGTVESLGISVQGVPRKMMRAVRSTA